ncbi:MAG: hypothetical protein V2J51_01050 [Erythrobacter sp.]|nr:hypothetical protein [Erythrobacter sp.]
MRRTVTFLGIALPALVSAYAHAAAPRAQTYSLPEGSASPTPAPQGPVDERAGVPIGPQVIAPEPEQPEPRRPAPAPRRAPARPAPTTATPPAPSPTPEPAQRSAPARAPSSREAAQAAPQLEAQSAPTSEGGEETAQPSGDEAPGPGFDSLPARESTPASERSDASFRNETGAPHAAGAGREERDGSAAVWIASALSVLALLGAAFGWLWWQRQRPARTRPLREGTIAARVSETIAAEMAGPSPPSKLRSAGKAPDPRAGSTPARALPHIVLGVDCTAATRSVMMFSAEFDVTLTNRSDTAARDIAVWATLFCARKGPCSDAGTPAPVATIARIGPHQSARVAASVQLPIGQVRAIRQGTTPLFVPLLEITSRVGNAPPVAQRFIVGRPSERAGSKLHPLPLDGVPGSFRGLKVRAIEAAPIDTPATEPA